MLDAAPLNASSIESKSLLPLETKSSHAKLLVVSAAHRKSLDRRVQQAKYYLKEHPQSVDGLVYTLGEKREHLPFRAYVVVDPMSMAPENIDELRPTSTEFTQGDPASINFVFTGQGSHWAGMGRSLVSKYPQVREDLRQMDAALMALPCPPGWSLLGAEQSTTSKTAETLTCVPY